MDMEEEFSPDDQWGRRWAEKVVILVDMTDKPKRRWFQYSLRTLFIITTLVAIACSWYVCEMQKAAKRRAAIAEIEKQGGYVYYYDASNPRTMGEPPRWFSLLRRLHGDEHLGNAVIVGMSRPITDSELVYLKGLTKLEHLYLVRLQVTDAGLIHLRDLTKLKGLWICGTQVTDAGLVNLEGLTNLEYLDLNDTQITDAGLEHLQGLTNLVGLVLSYTHITDDGLVRLKGLTSLEELHLGSTQITDAGLEHLKGLTNLKELDLRRTQVTNEGVKKLQETLPNCRIEH